MSILSDPIAYLQQEVAPTRRLLLNNGLYYQLQSLPDLRRFMEHHIFTVWDFIALVKALRRELVVAPGSQLPASVVARRFITEVVPDEETTTSLPGRLVSHFALYVRAMEECGADTTPIRQLVAAVTAGRPTEEALQAAQAPDAVRQFVGTTFSIIHSGKPHAVAAAVAFGHEEWIPNRLRQLVNTLRAQLPGQLDTFASCLDQHGHCATGKHALLGRELVRELCADAPERWQDCQEVAIRCLEARLKLWDGIGASTARRAVA